LNPKDLIQLFNFVYSVLGIPFPVNISILARFTILAALYGMFMR
jgi:hypothetical protein